ncbi:hypothetical protein R6Q57_014303 [Mikania cordata]
MLSGVAKFKKILISISDPRNTGTQVRSSSLIVLNTYTQPKLGGIARMLSRTNSTHQDKKITRSNLVEQLREYQIRTKHDWASISLFSPTSNLYTSRVDVVIFVIWELVILAFFVFSAVSLYYRQLKLALVLATVTLLLLLCMKVTKHVKLAHKKKRRMLLPLSM